MKKRLKRYWKLGVAMLVLGFALGQAGCRIENVTISDNDSRLDTDVRYESDGDTSTTESKD